MANEFWTETKVVELLKDVGEAWNSVAALSFGDQACPFTTWLDDVVAEVRDCVKGLLEKHGATSIGHWTSEVGDYSDRFIYIIAFEDMAQRQKAWDGFRADPEWHKVYEASLAKGAPVSEVVVGPRVGIDAALPEHRDAPWRLAEAGSRWVSQRGSLG